MARMKVWNGSSWDYIGNEVSGVVTEGGSQTLTNKTISGANNTISNISPSQRTGGFYIGTISGATLGSTGNKAITGVGFTPKLVQFQVNPNGSSTATDVQGSGAMTASSQFYQTTCSNGAIGYRLGGTSDCIAWISTGGTTPELLASYVSMDADGFTINVANASSTFPVSFIAYG